MMNNYPKHGQQGFQKGQPVVPTPPTPQPVPSPVGNEKEGTAAVPQTDYDLLLGLSSYLGSRGGSSGVLPEGFRRTNYSGYLLMDRSSLLSFLARRGVTPVYERVVFEHVTYQFPDKERAPECQRVEIVGHAEANGVQAVLVSVDGETRRPDGGFYHVTLSLAEGHKPVESNGMLESTPIIMFEEPIDVTVARF